MPGFAPAVPGAGPREARVVVEGARSVHRRRALGVVDGGEGLSGGGDANVEGPTDRSACGPHGKDAGAAGGEQTVLVDGACGATLGCRDGPAHVVRARVGGLHLGLKLEGRVGLCQGGHAALRGHGDAGHRLCRGVEHLEAVQLHLGARGLRALLVDGTQHNRMGPRLEVVCREDLLLALLPGRVGVDGVDHLAVNGDLEHAAVVVGGGVDLDARANEVKRGRLGASGGLEVLDGVVEVAVGAVVPVAPGPNICHAGILVVNHAERWADRGGVRQPDSFARRPTAGAGRRLHLVLHVFKEVVARGVGQRGLRCGRAHGQPVAAVDAAQHSIADLGPTGVNGVPRDGGRILGRALRAHALGRIRARDHGDRRDDIGGAGRGIERDPIRRERRELHGRTVLGCDGRVCGVSGVHRGHTAVPGLDAGGAKATLRPVHRYDKAAACHKPAHRAVVPITGKCGQQVDVAAGALEEHLRDAGGGAKVAVDLEGRMGVPQVGVDAALEEVADELEGAVAVAQMRPGVDALAHAPAGAGVGAQVHGRAGRLEPGRGVLRDERPREEPQHVREVTVRVALAQGVASGVLVVGVLDVPFLDLAVGAHLDGGAEVVEAVLPHREHLGVLAHELPRLDGVMEELPDKGLLVGVASRARALLGRVRGGRDVPAVLVLDEHLAVELRLLAKRRVDLGPQELDVAGIAIGVVGVLEDPWHGRRRPAPAEDPSRARPAKGGVLGVGHEAGALRVARLGLDARVDLGGHAAGLAQRIHVAQKRCGALGEVGRVDRPVVHLEVHVEVVVGRPLRAVGVVPHALEVAGELRVLARGGNGEVAAVLEERGLKLAPLGARGRAGLV